MWHMQSVDRKEVTYTDSSGKHRSLGKAVVNASMQGLARYNCSNELTNSMSRGKKKKNQRKKKTIKYPRFPFLPPPPPLFFFIYLAVMRLFSNHWDKLDRRRGKCHITAWTMCSALFECTEQRFALLLSRCVRRQLNTAVYTVYQLEGQDLT